MLWPQECGITSCLLLLLNRLEGRRPCHSWQRIQRCALLKLSEELLLLIQLLLQHLDLLLLQHLGLMLLQNELLLFLLCHGCRSCCTPAPHCCPIWKCKHRTEQCSGQRWAKASKVAGRPV